MDDIADFVTEYHVVSSVPDFQPKPADSRPTRLALVCRQCCQLADCVAA
jgi:hypothetical protein